MGPQKHQRDVENRLRESVRQDRARVQIGKISRFGLLEMSRQRLRPSLGESAYLTCPRCSGIGTIRSVESLALAILRIIGEEARKERTAKVIAQLPVEVATYLLNEKRDWVQSLESRNEMQVVLVANPALETPHYDVRRVRDDQADLPENAGASYELAEPDAEPETPQEILARKAVEPAALAVMKPSTPAPKREKPKAGFWAAVTSLFAGEEEEQPKKKAQQRRRKSGGQDGRSRGGQRSRRRSDERRSDDRKTKKKTTSKKKAASRDGGTQAKDGARRSKQGGKKPQPQKQKQGAQEQRDDARADGQKPARKRRSRGGRRRRGGDRPAQEGSVEQKQQAEQQQQAEAKPQAESKPKAESKPRAKPKPQAEPSQAKEKPAAESGPPKARTDAERAADSAAKAQKPADPNQTSPNLTPVRETKPAPQAQPGTEAKAQPRPESKPEPRPAPKPESKPEPKAESRPEPKVEAKPAPKPEPKPEGRLLPWDEPATKPAEPPKPPSNVESPPQD